jgi:hypothetical protein
VVLPSDNVVRLRVQPLLTSSDFAAALQCPERAKSIVRWILGTGRLRAYRLAVEIMDEERRRDGVRERRRGGGVVTQQGSQYCPPLTQNTEYPVSTSR